ncbi:MAG: hypothetical protein LBG43_07995 [Treponema sp.]|jgi:ABC-type glycerol-3-phosphate transport system permease component|nr:hypothetical protein [Treponema sp.]
MKGDRTFTITIYAALTLLALFTFLPMPLLIISFFTDENAILLNGHSSCQKTMLGACRCLLSQSGFILFPADILFHWTYYITRAELSNLQNILNRALQDVQFLHDNAGSMGDMDSELSKIPAAAARMAVAAVGAEPILILYPFFQRHFVKGVVIGAVKG